MYLAHAGHDHMSELTSTSISVELILGIAMLIAAVATVAFLVYDARKGRKAKTQK